ncbi:hypothetical protein BDQ17DRAFT_1368197 [Cyathus striatus]|nr:hypothetical protein BDQ17DRAFT_1368197 [Cyathus striatus]
MPPLPRPRRNQTIRSKSLWFADGNLIIHAPPVQFKVYAGILAARSAVFNDMLSFPPPPEGNEVVDGCVVVRLFGDDPGEVRWFLKAILDSSFFEPPPTPTTLPIIRAILRLSRKYSVPYLYTRALAHLHSTFPTTLQAWRARDTTRTIPPIDNTPFVTLQLAREFGLDWIVPSVVYCICSHPLEKTQKGAVWDPPKEVGEEWVRVEEKGEGEEGKTVLLDGDDRDMAVSCGLSLCSCRIGRVSRWLFARIVGSIAYASLNPLSPTTRPVFVGGLCPPCREVFKRECERLAGEMWDALPRFVGLRRRGAVSFNG